MSKKDTFWDETPDEQLCKIAEVITSNTTNKELIEKYQELKGSDSGRKDTNRSTDILDMTVGDIIVTNIAVGYSLSEAARAVGLTQAIVLKMQEREPEFRRRCNEAQSKVYTRVLLKLHEAIDAGSIDAIKFYLSHRYIEWMNPEALIKAREVEDNIKRKDEKSVETVEYEVIGNEDKDS